MSFLLGDFERKGHDGGWLASQDVLQDPLFLDEVGLVTHLTILLLVGGCRSGFYYLRSTSKKGFLGL